MSSVGDASDLPSEGKTLVIVADVGGVLHFRIFDGNGRIVVDTDETPLTPQARPIAALKKRLEYLWPLQQLGGGEKDQVITAVTSIVGHTLPADRRRPVLIVEDWRLRPFVKSLIVLEFPEIRVVARREVEGVSGVPAPSATIVVEP
jgi:hypothetical protein